MRRSRVLLTVVFVAVIGGSAMLYFSPIGQTLIDNLPGGNGVIGRLSLDDGSQFELVQHYNYPAEPYTIDFFFKLPGSPWGWCYIAHQDTRWRRARLQYNPGHRSVEVYRDDHLQAAYFLDRHTFAHYRKAYEIPAPQYLRDPPKT